MRSGLFVATAIVLFAVGLVAVIAHGVSWETSRWDGYALGLLRFTLFQAALSTLLSVVVGVVLARALYYTPLFVGRRWYIALFSVATVLPVLSVVLGLIGIYGTNGYLAQAIRHVTGLESSGFVYGLSGILIAHVFLNASYAARSFLTRYEAIRLEHMKLAAVLGMRTWRRFWIVEWPALAKTIAATAVTIFLLCFGSFAVILVLGASPRYNTLEVAIYQAVKFDYDIGAAMQLASLHMLVAIAVSILGAWVASEQSGGVVDSGRGVGFFHSCNERYWHRAVLIVGGFFFFAPLVGLFVDAAHAPFGTIVQDEGFWAAFRVSVISATLTACLVVPVAYVLAHARELSERAAGKPLAVVTRLITTLAANVYVAIPTLIMALGFFLLAMRSTLDTTLWAYIALISANVLASLPFAFALYHTLLRSARTRYGKLAEALGLSGFAYFRFVQWPFLRSATGYVAALSFCFSLGDMGVIALFGSDTFKTLPWYLYALMGSYRSDAAAGVGAILLLMSIAVFAVLPRLIGGRDVVR